MTLRLCAPSLVVSLERRRASVPAPAGRADGRPAPLSRPGQSGSQADVGSGAFRLPLGNPFALDRYCVSSPARRLAASQRLAAGQIMSSPSAGQRAAVRVQTKPRRRRRRIANRQSILAHCFLVSPRKHLQSSRPPAGRRLYMSPRGIQVASRTICKPFPSNRPGR